MYMQPPKQLVDLCLQASLMRAGAEALSGAKGVEAFVDEFLMGLLRKRWPIPDNKYEPGYGAMLEFVMEKASSFRPQDPRYTVDADIGTWLHAAPRETRGFLCDPENLQALEEVLKDTLQVVTKACGGDPLNAATLAKTSLKSSFDAIKNSTPEAKAARLDETIAFVNAGLQKYNQNNLPAKQFWQSNLIVSEFWQRLGEKLLAKDWPFFEDNDGTLMAALKLLARGGSYAKLEKALKELPEIDSSMKAETIEKLAWSANFVLSNSKDVREAAEAVFQALENEARTPKGISLMRSALSQKMSPN